MFETDQRISSDAIEQELAAVKRELDQREKAWQHELAIAERVHRSMLPKPVRHTRIDIDVRYVPVEKVGGDYCQVLFPSDACCYVTICDVTGHGIGPALLATRVSSEVRRLVFEQLHPADVVQKLNDFMIENFGGAELMLTFFAARFDFQQETLTYSGAGHPGPLLIRGGSGDIEVLSSQNLVIGVHDECLSDRPADTCPINPADRLIFYTDGLTETMDANDKQLGIDGVIRLATNTCAGDIFDMADCFLEGLAAFGNGPPQDDITIIVAELK